MKKTILSATFILCALLSTAALAVNDGGTGSPDDTKTACETCTFLDWFASWWVF